jgi:hypothetical protein
VPLDIEARVVDPHRSAEAEPRPVEPLGKARGQGQAALDPGSDRVKRQLSGGIEQADGIEGGDRSNTHRQTAVLDAKVADVEWSESLEWHKLGARRLAPRAEDWLCSRATGDGALYESLDVQQLPASVDRDRVLALDLGVRDQLVSRQRSHCLVGERLNRTPRHHPRENDTQKA